jgi:hypothetical protein
MKMERKEALIKLKSIATDLDEKAGNVLHEGMALQEMAGKLLKAVNMLEKDEDGYMYLQMCENVLSNICHIDMYNLKDIEDSFNTAAEVIFETGE